MDFDDVLVVCGLLLVGLGIYQFSPGLAAIVVGATCVALGIYGNDTKNGEQR